MPIRFVSGRPAAWRRRFVEIARTAAVASAGASPAAVFALRRRPGPRAPARIRRESIIRVPGT